MVDWIESRKNKPKIKKNNSQRQFSHMSGKQTHLYIQLMNNYFTKTMKN